MAEAPIMPLATDAYLADTTHLSTTEHGAYLLLIICLWRAGGRLPNDHQKLAKFCRLSPGQFKRIWPVLEPFFFIDGDQIGQGKLQDFLDAVRRKSHKASDSARAKWRKNKETGDAVAPVKPCVKHAIQDPANQDPKNPPIAPPAGGREKRGSRLPDDWQLPKAWGEWALQNSGMTDSDIRREAEQFRDYWHSISGAKARKLDWLATWRMWCRKWAQGRLHRKPSADRRNLSIDDDLNNRGVGMDLEKWAEETGRYASEDDKRNPVHGAHTNPAPSRDAANDVSNMFTVPAEESG